jgi:glycosyltransferase involved in cell wall biosynthesis
VIIPVYNEAQTIGEVIDRVAAVPVEKETLLRWRIAPLSSFRIERPA